MQSGISLICLRTRTTKKYGWDSSRRLQEQKKGAEAEVKVLEARSRARTEGLINPERLREGLERFTAGFETMDASANRNLLANILEKVEVMENEIVLHIKNPDMPLPKDKNAKGDFVNLRTKFSTRRKMAPRERH